MRFRPSIHGWPFDNERSWDPSALGLGASPLPELGLSGGMCWAALDRYLSGVEIARDLPAPGPGDPLYAELVRRQVAALSGVWERVRDWQSPDGQGWRSRLPGAGRALARRSRAEWRGVRRRLNAGEPVLLTVLPEADGYSRGRAAWQVLATGWAKDGGRIRLSIYDPARPGDDAVHLSFGRRGALDARVTGGHPLRGFFMVAYDRRPGLVLRAETFADRSVLGLNRKVRGGLWAVAHGQRLELVGRDPDSALVHFRRNRGAHWESANVTDRDELGSHELHSDPRAVRVGSRLHVFARSYVGDLLHFRRGRRWDVANLTDQKRTGARFRVTGNPVPVAGPRGRLSVVGRDKEGGLVHYRRSLLRGWTAEQVAGEPIAGDPQALSIGETIHVVAVTGDRRLLAWERSDERSWVRTDLSTGLEKGPSVRVTGRPALLAHGGTLHVFARDRDDRVIHLHRAADGLWSATVRADGATGDPAVTHGPAGIHVFAPAGEHGMIHLWGARGWQWEDVVATRPSLGGGAGWSGPLTAWGSGAELRVVGRQGAQLMVFAWRPDTDWTATSLDAWTGVDERHRTVDDPIVVTDGTGAPHLFATDGRGTVIHIEPGRWVEPGSGAPRRDRRKAPIPARPAPAAAREAPEPEPEPEPLPLLEDPALETAPEGAFEADEGPEAAEPLPVLDDPEIEMDSDFELEFEPTIAPAANTAQAGDPEPEGVVEGEPEIEADPVAEALAEAEAAVAFEPVSEADIGDAALEAEAALEEAGVTADPEDHAEADIAVEADEDEPTDETDEADEADAVAEADEGDEVDDTVDPLPFLEFADEPEEPGESDDVAATGDAREDGQGAGTEEGAAPNRKEFPWEHVAESGERVVEEGAPAGGAAQDVEPMDLSLLDSWPPKAPLRTGSGKSSKKGPNKGTTKGRRPKK